MTRRQAGIIARIKDALSRAEFDERANKDQEFIDRARPRRAGLWLWIPVAQWDDMMSGRPKLTRAVYTEDMGNQFECTRVFASPSDTICESKLSAFLGVLDELGCEASERAERILKFQHGGYDLDAYLRNHSVGLQELDG